MKIFAIDPGTKESAYVVYSNAGLYSSGIIPNEEMKEKIGIHAPYVDLFACEMIASYGMPVGKEVFETCMWIGRFQEILDGKMRLVERGKIKLHLCNSSRAKDSNIRQALIDRFGPPGTKLNPGWLFGVTSHKWSALAIAIYILDQQCPDVAGMVGVGT